MSQRLASPLLCAAVIAAGVWLVGSPVVAAERPPVVLVEHEQANCSQEFGQALLDELRMRTAAQLVFESAEADGTAEWTLALSAYGAQSCHIRLQGDEEVKAFMLAQDAERLEIAAVATRLAWIIDGVPVPEDAATMQTVSQTTESSVSPRVSTSSDATSSDAKVSEQMPSGVHGAAHAHVLVEATAGAMWIPSAAAGLTLVRVGASWQPWSWLRVGLVGRLPLGTVQEDVVGTRYSYRPWSADLLASYVHRLSQGWSLSAGLGGRYTMSEITAAEVYRGVAGDVLAGTPARVTGQPDSPAENALSPWSAVASAGASWAPINRLAVNLDTSAAMSLADRKVRDDQRVIMDLGRFEFDMLLGLELRF